MAVKITQAGNLTLVSKLVYGPPVRTAVSSGVANINTIQGLSTAGAVGGSLFVYDSDAGEWRTSNIINNQVIDGRVYPSDSDRAEILIRRSGTQGDPQILRTGELAYSWLADSGSSAIDGYGNGGDRLFIGVGSETDSAGVSYAERIEIIGGKYFTDLLNHAHGTLTASSAIITDSESRVNRILVDELRGDSATLENIDITQSATIATASISNLSSQDAFISNATITSSIVNNSTVNQLQVDSSLTVSGQFILNSAIDFNFPATFNNDVNIGEISLREFIDSSVFNLLVGGQSVTLSYNDSANTLTIDADLATISDPGVASFDSSQFNVSGGGAVSIIELNGGTY